MTDVELVPEGLDVDTSAPVDRRAPPRPGRRAVVVTALVVAVGLAALLEGRSERADLLLAHAVAPAGSVTSLREPVGEVWRATGRVVGGGADVLVLAEAEPSGTTLTGRSAPTGDVLWTQELTPARVRCPRTLEAVDTPRDLVRGTPEVLVLCEVRPWPVQTFGDGQLWVLDPADGSVRARRTLGARTSWDVLGNDLVMAQQAGRDLRVSRESLVGARVVWAVSLALPDGVSAAQVDLRVGDGLVAIGGAMGAVLTSSGDVLGRWERGSRGAVAVRTDVDGFAVWSESGEGLWFDRSGRPGVRLPGEPVDVLDRGPGSTGDPFVGDARAGMPDDLLLVRTPGGIAVADVTGRGLLWSRGAARTREVLVVGGTAVLATRSQVRAVELTHGRSLWTAERGLGTDTGSLLTDGLRVVVPGHEAGAGRSVTVRSIADGEVLWTAPLPRGAAALEAGPGGVLLASVPGGVVVVGP